MLLNGDLPTEDFHLISSCPCWAYTIGSRRTAYTTRFCVTRCAQTLTQNRSVTAAAVPGVLLTPKSGLYSLKVGMSAIGTEQTVNAGILGLGLLLTCLYPKNCLPGGIKLPGNGADTDPGVNAFNHRKLLFFIQCGRTAKPLSCRFCPRNT